MTNVYSKEFRPVPGIARRTLPPCQNTKRHYDSKGELWGKMSVRTSDAVAKSLLLLLIRQGDEKNTRDFYKQMSVATSVILTIQTVFGPAPATTGKPAPIYNLAWRSARISRPIE